MVQSALKYFKLAKLLTKTYPITVPNDQRVRAENTKGDTDADLTIKSIVKAFWLKSLCHDERHDLFNDDTPQSSKTANGTQHELKTHERC